MSRSYREPFWTEGYKSKTRRKAKRAANKAVRNSTSSKSGKAYKKEYNSWDIVDFKFKDDDDHNYKVRRK